MTGPIEGFSGPETISDGTVAKPVYTSLQGEKSLILVHELPGMSMPFLDYCRDLAGQGYRVTMPLLFGEPGSKMDREESRAFCMTREFKSLFDVVEGKEEARPFTAWLLHLTRVVVDRSPAGKVAVIGMCLTGGFALATIAETGVAAAVACQPAFPFFWQKGSVTLGLSRDERDRAAQRARLQSAEEGRPCLQGYRHRWDYMSWPHHLWAAKRIFGKAFEGHTLAGRGHSTVTAQPRNQEVADGISEFLSSWL